MNQVLFLIVATTAATMTIAAGSFELLLLHTNDVHSRFEQADERGGTCSEKEARESGCWGGYPRIATKVKML